jgi:hypothetical protein
MLAGRRGSPSRAVIRPGGNHVDRRRLLLPRDYLADPAGFGQDRPARLRTPPDGDAPSARIAWLQHQLVAAWRRQGCKPSGAALGRAFGFSRQTISRSALGQRWMGEAVLAALLTAVRCPPASPQPHPSRDVSHG